MVYNVINSSTGETMAPKDFQRSSCGEQFDEYVFQALDPFPWSLVDASCREVKNLWNERRFKIHYNGTWREGHVCGWKQYNPCSSRHVTKWNLELELDTVEVGDVVNISGTICTVDEGAFVIKVPHEGETNEIAIKLGNVKLPRFKLGVNRMNVHGGGTLKEIRDDEDAPLISLEWLQPASPSINLNKGILLFDCPC
jgi:hypothetical protein